MSCNGCRVLRKGCSESCLLRHCLDWIRPAEAQAHATLFLAKFFGRAALLSFISKVPALQRPSLFQSLLFEACGRTINPVGGSAGLLAAAKWDLCQAAVETVLRGGALKSLADQVAGGGGGFGDGDELLGLYGQPGAFSTVEGQPKAAATSRDIGGGLGREKQARTPSEGSVTTAGGAGVAAAAEPRLLELFV